MFGDIGHGLIIFVAAILMILAEKKMAKADLGEVRHILLITCIDLTYPDSIRLSEPFFSTLAIFRYV